MAEFFQDKRSDPPTYHVPSEYPKHMYGGNPVNSDEEVKTGLANGSIKTKTVHNEDQEKALSAKGWVVDLKELIEEADPESVQAIEGEPEFELVMRKRRKKNAPPLVDEDVDVAAAGEDGEPSMPRRRRRG